MGDTEPFAGTATLFNPDPITPEEVVLFLLDFDPDLQQLLYELPDGIESKPGTYLLKVSTGIGINQFDAFNVAIGASALKALRG